MDSLAEVELLFLIRPHTQPGIIVSLPAQSRTSPHNISVKDIFQNP